MYLSSIISETIETMLFYAYDIEFREKPCSQILKIDYSKLFIM